jgi:hypothetical protein
MLLSADTRKHGFAIRTPILPPDLKDYEFPGSRLNCVRGDFGTVISQLIPNDEHVVSLHHLFLYSAAWLQFPFNEIESLLLYNHGKEIPVRIDIGTEQLPIGPGDIQADSFHTLGGLKKPYPLHFKKGNYSFFTIDTSSRNMYLMAKNRVVMETYFLNLKSFLMGIVERLPK